MSLPISNCSWPQSGPLPPKQEAVLGFIRGEMATRGRFPTLAAIAKFMGWLNDGSAYDCLCRLEWRGKLKRETVDGAERGALLRYRWDLVA